MAVIDWDELRGLAEVRVVDGYAVSLYIDLEPRTTPTWSDVQTRVASLLSEAGRLTDELDDGRSRSALRKDLERIERFFDREFTRDGTAGLALFASSPGDLWRELSLPRAPADEIRVDHELLVRPLVPLVGAAEEALVAVFNHRRGSLYLARNGRLDELADVTDPEVASRHDQGGWSQSRYERYFDELAQRHLKRVASELARDFRQRGRPPVVLVCPEDERAELERELDREVASAVVGWTTVEAHASAAAVGEVVRPLLAEDRRRRRAEVLARVAEERGQGGRATCGWEPVLEAVEGARVEVLLYERDANAAVNRCPSCDHVQVNAGTCPVDGATLVAVPDGLDLALRRALARGATALEVEDAATLGEPVCALLRW